MPKSIHEIIVESCSSFRKGSDLIIDGRPATPEQREALMKGEDITANAESDHGVMVVEIFDMPNISDTPEGIYLVDVHFIVIGVNLEKAEENKADIIAWLQANLEPREYSYIELGGVIEDQGMAFALMAMGEALKLWKVLTPEVMGMPAEMCDQMAGMGYITVQVPATFE
jgi:hypothetical protein